MLSESDRADKDPRRDFYRDIKNFLSQYVNNENNDNNVIPILIGDWNEECKGRSNTQKLCDDFDLVNIFHRLNPEHKQFKTYI